MLDLVIVLADPRGIAVNCAGSLWLLSIVLADPQAVALTLFSSDEGDNPSTSVGELRTAHPGD